MKEEWRDILGYEGLYQASTYGRIRSLDKYSQYKNSNRFVRGRILKQRKNKSGYLQLGLTKDGEYKTHNVHSIILIVFDRPPKSGEECNHGDGDKSNNFIDNLEWCTSSENNLHRTRVLKKGIGEKHPLAKLTEQQVREIKGLLKEGELTQQQIANMYNVGRTIISDIKLGKRWKHIKM